MSRRNTLSVAAAKAACAGAAAPAARSEPAVHGHGGRRLRHPVGHGLPSGRSHARDRAARNAEALYAGRRERRHSRRAGSQLVRPGRLRRRRAASRLREQRTRVLELCRGRRRRDAWRGRRAGEARARANGGELQNPQVIWRQSPKVDGGGHYSHRIAFGGGYLWISSGDRQKFDPAQDMNANLGKVLRLNEDG